MSAKTTSPPGWFTRPSWGAAHFFHADLGDSSAARSACGAIAAVKVENLEPMRKFDVKCKNCLWTKGESA